VNLVVDTGVEGDAHAGAPNRQVSLLCDSSIEAMRNQGARVGPGDFAENFTVTGCTWRDFPVGTRVRLARGPILQVTQIGKECHTGCAIARQVGTCVMPREGIFARVLVGGTVLPGDRLEVLADEP
jgi:MOSC domain-containing protein YiiM